MMSAEHAAAATPPTTTALLAGVRVLDLSLLGPGALGGHLADLGADVVKIESPSGDYVREMTWPIVNGTSLMHLHVNRGKRSAVVDLKSPAGRGVFDALVQHADVLIEAMRPGFLDKVGYGAARLAELNPALVTCSLSGYGATGPYRNLPAHGVAFDTWAGQITPVVDEDGFCRIPDQVNIGITAGPAYAAMAILAALVRARTTGVGATLDVAQSDAAAYFDWYRIESWRAYEQPEDVVTGNRTDDFERRRPGLGGMTDAVRYQVYESADGHVLFMASEQSFWHNFCAAVDRLDLYQRWPGARYADHARGNVELHRELRSIFRTRTSAEWLRLADAHNTTIAIVNTPRTVVDDPQFRERFDWTMADQTGCEQLRFPARVVGAEPASPTMAPAQGEHTDAVLREWLGLSPDQLDALRGTGAVA
jgi:crotonobetainyl-CoA:carnitine CoA-transferase CaiB-like acyl-CoA transferase